MPTLPFFRCGPAFQPTYQISQCRLGRRSKNCCQFGHNPRCTTFVLGSAPYFDVDPTFFRCGAAFQPTNQISPCRLGQRSENCCQFARNPRCTDQVRVGMFLQCRPYLFFRCSAAFQTTDQRSSCRLGQMSENCCRFGRNPRCTTFVLGSAPFFDADPTFFSVQCGFSDNRSNISM